MEKGMSLEIQMKIQEELSLLDNQTIKADGIYLKPSQCYRFSLNPLHVLFNTNCPKNLKTKVLAILKKYNVSESPANTKELFNIENKENIPASVKELKPLIYKEDEEWHAVPTEDIGAEISGHGDTPEKAMEDFDSNYSKLKENSY